VQLDINNLPTDTALLHQLVRDMAAVVERRDGEIERLRLIIKKLQRGQFGRRSERADDQLELGLEDAETDLAQAEEPALDETPPDSERGKKRPKREPLRSHLPRQEIVIDVAVTACPCCGGALHKIGDSVSEMLDWIPASLRVVRITRPKYGCRACESVHQAPAPERPIAGGLATPALIAHVLVSKYGDHLPLYRQARIFGRHGLEIDRSTLAGWVGGACWWLDALHKELCAEVFASNHLFADDTTVPVLDPGRGRTKTGRLWVYVRDDRPWCGPEPPAAVFVFKPDRTAERPETHLAGFKGVLQVDGYARFERLTDTGAIELAACWAHTRRGFYDIAQGTASPIAVEALRRIGELYHIEERLCGNAPELRLAGRRTWSAPIIKAFRPWLEQQLAQIPASSTLADAIRYTLVRWEALTLFLRDGRVELDTNPVERAIRPVTLGRKNHLFAGSDDGGARWATLCSLITTCKLNDVEPYEYLRDVLQRMIDGHPVNRLGELLPWNWKRPPSR